MNFDEFRQASKRTMRFEPEHRANAALGLVGELGEFFGANSIQGKLEEAGDCLFYLAWLCEFYDITLHASPIDDRDDLFHYAAEVADMVKKHVFHGKEPNIERMTICLSNIHDWFAVVYEHELSNILKANIAKLLIRHPIEKGYTNEGQNMRADEIVTQCNPCACDRGGDIWHKIVDGYHTLACSYCGFGTCDKDLAMAIEKWNSINIDAPVADDAAHIQAYAQSGNAEQTAAAYEATNQERFWRSLVKRTPELPADNQRVLLWWQERWTDALFSEMARCWFTKVMVCVDDGQYWLPLPSFNPESEG